MLSVASVGAAWRTLFRSCTGLLRCIAVLWLGDGGGGVASKHARMNRRLRDCAHLF